MNERLETCVYSEIYSLAPFLLLLSSLTIHVIPTTKACIFAVVLNAVRNDRKRHLL